MTREEAGRLSQVLARVGASQGITALACKLRFYDDWAPEYDKDVAALKYRAPCLAVDCLSRALPGPPQDALILDVACGTGLVAVEQWGREATEDKCYRGHGCQPQQANSQGQLNSPHLDLDPDSLIQPLLAELVSNHPQQQNQPCDNGVDDHSGPVCPTAEVSGSYMPALHPFSHILEPRESSTRRRKQTAIAISSCKFFIVHHLGSTQLTMENSQTSVAREVLTIQLHC